MSGPGLVEQLQSDALDQSVPVSTLLRKVKVAAVKLSLSDTLNWADSELKGYTDAVPDYRMISGRSMAKTSFGDWLAIGGDENVLSALRKRALGQSISSLEELMKSDERNLMMPYPPSVVSRLGLDWTEAALFISTSNIAAVIDHVRNLVLDWALDLERAGITGEGLRFTQSEQRAAAASHINIQIDGANARLNIGSEDHSLNLSGETAKSD